MLQDFNCSLEAIKWRDRYAALSINKRTQGSDIFFSDFRSIPDPPVSSRNIEIEEFTEQFFMDVVNEAFSERDIRTSASCRRKSSARPAPLVTPTTRHRRNRLKPSASFIKPRK